MKQEFINAVNNHDLPRVRMMLSNELLFDPRGKTFSEMLQYAKDNLADLFEENEASDYEIPTDESLWTNELVSRVKRDLNTNFSVEKLALFEKMAMATGKDKASELNRKDEEARKKAEEARKAKEKKAEESHGTNTRRRTTSSCTSQKATKTVGTIVTVSGAALLVTGLCLGKTVLSVSAGVLAVGGIVLMAVSKNK